MSTKDNEINRTVDDTAEGHIRVPNFGDAEAGKTAAVRSASLDDEADGHLRVRTIDEAEAAKKAALRTAALDDEADGHLRFQP